MFCMITHKANVGASFKFWFFRSGGAKSLADGMMVS